MCTDDKTKNAAIRSLVAAIDRSTKITGEPKILPLLDSVQMPADLTDATRFMYQGIQRGTNHLHLYSLKCLILLEKNQINQRQCDYYQRLFEAMTNLKALDGCAGPASLSPKGPANDPTW